MPILDVESQEKLKKQLTRHEGLELRLYKCTEGKQTIGIGRNLDDLGISEDEAMYMLDNDLARIEVELEKNIPVLSGLSDNRKIVLMNMAFNLGISRLLQFKNMLAALAQHDYKTASAEMLNSRWSKQVGSRANELSEMMLVG
ncbi:glycoside hydrolase family protein [Pseudomonas sp. HK3]|jgi:lysozyme